MQEIPIVLLGHKDHGKSTLIGRLILDSGSIKESRIKEIKEVAKASGQKFELAHLVDSFKEEREREMTMDTARVFLKGRERNYQLIDVPGHAELVSNMLTGASSAEAAVLVVSVTEGIKEQTLEHLEIAKLLGIEQLGVAVNKMDKFNYQKEKFDELVKDLKEVLSKIGYSSEEICFFPVSAWRGDNVVSRSEKTNWYQGKTIMEFFENEVKEPESFDSLPLSFLVQDKYSGNGDEIIIGRVESGVMKTGEEVLILPENKKSKVKSIRDSEDGLEKVGSGQNVGVELADKLEINRGSVISSLDSGLEVGNNLSGDIFWIEKPSRKELVLECGTAEAKGELQEPGIIREGKKTFYQILLEKPIVFNPEGKTVLGKMILKDKGKIIAVGNIT